MHHLGDQDHLFGTSAIIIIIIIDIIIIFFWKTNIFYPLIPDTRVPIRVKKC